MVDHHDDDLAAQKTEGFKVGEKKTLQEYQELGKSCFPRTAQLP
jgi:Rho GDP-dissociation inhibitor